MSPPSSATSRGTSNSAFLLRLEAAKEVPLEAVAAKLGVPFGLRTHVRCSMKLHLSDSTPSLKFYPNNSFACFGCRAGGSPLDFVAGVRGVPLGAALVWLELTFLRDRTFRSAASAGVANFSGPLLARLRARRQNSTELNFSAVGYKEALHALLVREGKCLFPLFPGQDWLIRSSLLVLAVEVDELWDGSNKSECEAAAESLSAGLVCLQERAASAAAGEAGPAAPGPAPSPARPR